MGSGEARGAIGMRGERSHGCRTPDVCKILHTVVICIACIGATRRRYRITQL